MSLWQRSLLFRSLKPRKILGLALVFVVLMIAALGSTAFGQEYTDIRRLGTSNAVFKPGPQTRADLQRVFRDHRADYEKVLRDTNWPGDPDDLFSAVENGDFSEAQYPVGHTFEWMAVRKRGVVQATGRIRWAGRDPFEAFEIRFESNGREHRFLVPKACGNLSLIQMRDAGPPPLTAVPRVNVQSPNQCTGTNVTVDVTVPGMPDGGEPRAHAHAAERPARDHHPVSRRRRVSLGRPARRRGSLHVQRNRDPRFGADANGHRAAQPAAVRADV